MRHFSGWGTSTCCTQRRSDKKSNDFKSQGQKEHIAEGSTEQPVSQEEGSQEAGDAVVNDREGRGTDWHREGERRRKRKEREKMNGGLHAGDSVCGTQEESFPGNPSLEWRLEAGVFSWEPFHLCTYVHVLSVDFTYF